MKPDQSNQSEPGSAATARRSLRDSKNFTGGCVMQVNGILETALYVADPAGTAAFYRRLFGFDILVESERLVALDVVGRSVLLLFREGSTSGPYETGGGVIPAHAGAPPTHFAFGIAAEGFDAWLARLEPE